jgi:hypothetical protein
MSFHNNGATFQDDTSPMHTARSVQSWFEEHEEALQHLPWAAQSPDLNIIDTLWSVLENGVRSRYSPPSSLKQLENVPREERYSIPLETIQNLQESIPRRIPAVLQAKLPNSVLIKKCVSFTTVSIFLSIPCTCNLTGGCEAQA